MTPHNPTPEPAVDFDSFWPSYRHHLRLELAQISVIDLAGTAAVAALTGWLAYTAHQEGSFFGAMAAGAVVLYLVHGVWAVALAAAQAAIEARPWYGIGRTVHHQMLGRCEVLDFDDRPETAHVWVLAQPREVEGAAAWLMACEFAESAEQLHAEGEDA